MFLSRVVLQLKGCLKAHHANHKIGYLNGALGIIQYCLVGVPVTKRLRIHSNSQPHDR
jgi:hypothetical protein